MRSRALRMCGAVMAWLALGSSGAFLYYSQRQLLDRRAADRTFDTRARELTDALSDLRASQQAYVAAGQGVQFWMPRVEQTVAAVQQGATEIRTLALSSGARDAVDLAANALAQFREADDRSREYIRADQPLMAADVIFGEGREAAASAARHIESARLAEHQAMDAVEGEIHRQQAIALGAAGGFAGLVLLMLGTASPRAVPVATAATEDESASTQDTSLPLQMPVAAAPLPVPTAPPLPQPPAILPGLMAAADLCTDFGRIGDISELQRLVTRASDAMNATGLVVWLEAAAGSELEPVLAHGYTAETMARMPRLPRDADNAAAAAYRTGTVQVVRAKSGSSGALVVPILSANGPLGAISAELADSSESSDAVQAIARIVAAQLAGVLQMATDVPAAEPRAAASR